MAKKKKKKALDFSWWSSNIPGIVSTNSVHWHNHGSGYTVTSYRIIIPGPSMGYWDSRAKGASDAFMRYTFSGPLDLMAGKSVVQAGVLTGVGTYSSFRLAVAVELGMDFAILGIVLTIADPGNLWEGGLDEWGFLGGNQQESLPSTMSGGEGTTFLWGLKQGHLGFLFGG